MATAIDVLYRLGFYRLAHKLAAKYMPPIHYLIYDDEPGVE